MSDDLELFEDPELGKTDVPGQDPADQTVTVLTTDTITVNSEKGEVVK